MTGFEDKQKDVQKFWDATPCDSEMSQKQRNDISYYEEIEQDRYLYQSHINDILDWIDWEKKKALEIGTGVGTDARNIIRRGGIYQGINVDLGSVSVTANALEIFGHEGSVDQCSATEMMFEDDSFDVVYSFGVLHHIPDVDSAVSEITRVLKPGGELLIMLYNRTSINYKLEILVLRKLFVRLLMIPGVIRLFALLGLPESKLRRHAELFSSKEMNEKEWLSRNTDGPDNPYSLVYDSREVEALLGNFKILRDEVFFFDFRHWGLLGKLMPKFMVNYLGRRLV